VIRCSAGKGIAACALAAGHGGAHWNAMQGWWSRTEVTDAAMRVEADVIHAEAIAAARAKEADAICRAVAESDPIGYEEWLESLHEPGFMCCSCWKATGESEPGFNAQDKTTAKHYDTCPWIRAVKYAAHPGGSGE
jgi:hypothetical protein